MESELKRNQWHADTIYSQYAILKNWEVVTPISFGLPNKDTHLSHSASGWLYLAKENKECWVGPSQTKGFTEIYALINMQISTNISINKHHGLRT
jgi:hypothetical protein